MAGNKGIRAGRAFVELFTDNSKLVRGLRGAERRIKAFGAKIRNMGAMMTGLSAAMAAPLVGAVKHFANYGDEVAKMAKRTGMSVEALSALRYVASQTGTDFKTLENGLRRMQRSIYDAGRGLSTATDALKDLGIEFSSLDGLSPEKQFMMIAEGLSKISDPTKRAAIAMSLLGRSGTMLLPMMANGAKGIDKLMAKAKALGLVMSKEDAAAAETLTDSLDSLWKTVKMAAFYVGASLGPEIEKISDTFVRWAKTIGDYVNQNRGLIVSLAKIVLVVGGVGIALISLGVSIQIVAFAIGGLAKIFVLAAGAFKLVVVALGLILSPIGLAITAIVGLGAVILHVTGAGGAALGWLGARFASLKDDAIKAFGAIGDALAAGDIGLAVKILWLTIQLQWEKGVAGLKKSWNEFKFGFQALFIEIKHSVLDTWLDIVKGLKNGWSGFLTWHQTQVETWANWMAKRLLDVQGLFDDSLDTDFAKKQVDIQTNQRMAEIAGDDKKRRGANDSQYAADSKANEAARIAALTKIVNDNEASNAEIVEALKQARKEWQDSLKTAQDTSSGGGTDGPGKPNFKDWLAGVGQVAATAKRTIGVSGTFNAARASGMGVGSSVASRTADATEKTAKNTKKIADNTKSGGLSFA